MYNCKLLLTPYRCVFNVLKFLMFVKNDVKFSNKLLRLYAVSSKTTRLQSNRVIQNDMWLCS